MSFMLTYIDTNNPEWVFGLCDFGQGKPRMSMICLPVAEHWEDEPYMLHLEANEQFELKHPISIYAQAAHLIGKITINDKALEMAATHLEFQQQRDKMITPVKRPHPSEIPAFMPLPPN